MSAAMHDIKADHLWEKAQLIFPDVCGRVNSYSRKGNTLYMHTQSKNTLIFICVGNEWILGTDKFVSKHVNC